MEKSEEKYEIEETPSYEVKPTTRRWFVLMIYFGNAALCSFQWVNYVMIPDIFTEYFGIDNGMISWTTQLYMVSFCVLIFPIIWWLDGTSVRVAHLWGSGLGLLAAAFKCVVGPDLWVMSFVGQLISSFSNIFLFVMPAIVSAVWFPESELSIASAIAAGGLITGNALGYVVPPLIVQGPVDAFNGTDYPSDWASGDYPETEAAIEEVGAQLFLLFLIQACCVLVFFVFVIFGFPAQPEHPPSVAEGKKRATVRPKVAFKESVKVYGKSILELLKNFKWVMLATSGGLMSGVFFAICTLINQIIKPTFCDQSDQNALNKQIGQMSFWMLIAGFLGSSCIGIILDKTKKFRIITLSVTVLYCALYSIFTIFVVEEIVWVDTLLLSLVGACCSSMFNLLLQFGIELTYPASITVMVGLNGLIQQILGVVLTQLGQALISADEDIVCTPCEDNDLECVPCAEAVCPSTQGSTNANITMCAALGGAILLQLFVKEDLRRQRAEKNQVSDESIDVTKGDEEATGL